MNNHQNKYDFKNYLLGLESSGYSQDDFIFWRKKIPLPLDLIYRLYEERDQLIFKYIDHLLSIIIYNDLQHQINSTVDIGLLPDGKYLTNIKQQLLKQIHLKFNSNDRYSKLASEINATLGISNYSLTPEKVIISLSHNGKKYSRLYIPKEIKDIMSSHNPNILAKVGISNNDMFGNIICDHFNIYRGGFSDAFASIFNDLIKFLMKTKGSYTSSNNSITFESHVAENVTDYLVEFVTTLNGKIWEPAYKNGKIGVRINKSHIFINSLSQSELKKVIPLLIAFCEDEYSSYDDKKAKIMAEFRESASRYTRLKLEK